MKTFMDALLAGEVTPDQISDHVGAWHESDSTQSLHEYLGMTEEEYSRWVMGTVDTLQKIIEERRINGHKP